MKKPKNLSLRSFQKLTNNQGFRLALDYLKLLDLYPRHSSPVENSTRSLILLKPGRCLQPSEFFFWNSGGFLLSTL